MSQDFSEQYQHEHNSFVTGFTFGLFAGAAGYFLFATKKGEQLRQQLADDWEDAKEHMVKEGLIPHNKVSLRDFVKHIFDQTVSHTPPVQLRPMSSDAAKKARGNSPKLKKESAKKFKGV